MTVLLLSSSALHSSSLTLCLAFLFFLFFFFSRLLFGGSDVAKPLYLRREKPVAGLYWTDYHAPSVGAIRDARARIQGPVTCPVGE